MKVKTHLKTDQGGQALTHTGLVATYPNLQTLTVGSRSWKAPAAASGRGRRIGAAGTPRPEGGFGE